MMTDETRRGLHEAVTKVLGREYGNALMELLPPVGWSDLARQSDITAVRGEMSVLRGEMSELRAELKGEMSELRAELKGEMAELRGEMRALLPKLVTANIASMIGVSGLVLAAASLA